MKTTATKFPLLIAAGVLAAGALLAACSKPAPGKQVHVYNWSDYIADDTNDNFEKASGIHVTYDVFDTDEVLQTKLLTGNSGFDVVVPSSAFLGREIQAGTFLPLDKSRLPNHARLDPVLLKRLSAVDPDNTYAVPYMWGTLGIGYNVDKIKAVFGGTDVTRSLDLVFKPENLAKLKQCGITFLDSPIDIVPLALNYLHQDPNSTDPAVVRKAAPLLKAIRPYITNFDSSSYLDALANGDVCLVLGYSGDVLQARDRAKEAGNGVDIAYSIPREGTSAWFDSFVIPKDAKNREAAYAYINYMLDPKVEAANTDKIGYPNPVPESQALVKPEIAQDPSVYPSAEVIKTLYDQKVMPQPISELYNRIWTDLKTGK